VFIFKKIVENYKKVKKTLDKEIEAYFHNPQEIEEVKI
jgi:hypothetical protein